MLKPDENDPNYKEEAERYKKDPGSWGAPTLNPVPVVEDVRRDGERKDNRK